MNTQTGEVRSLTGLSDKELARIAQEKAERVPINREEARASGWKPIDHWVAVKSTVGNRAKLRRRKKIADASRRKNRGR